MRPTVRALILRGFSTCLAESLSQDGNTLGKLQSMSETALEDLGVPPECRLALEKGRSPIPEATVYGLLNRCRRTCCVCRDASKGIVIHHIVPWAESHCHDASNLVVLCSNHHDEAHTKKELSRELAPAELRHHKEQWEKEVHASDTEALFARKSTNLLGAVWDMFNRQRLLDCAKGLGIDPAIIPGASTVAADDATLRVLPFRWSGRPRGLGEDEYSFFASLLRGICDQRDWINLRSVWSRRKCRILLPAGTLVALTAHHRFRQGEDATCGPGQVRTGYYASGGLRLEFTIDAWECTSNSAYATHLTGGWTCTSLGLVRSIESVNSSLVISATCLAIGTGFTEYTGATPIVALKKEANGQEESVAW